MKKRGIAQEEKDQQRETSELDKCNNEILQLLNVVARLAAKIAKKGSQVRCHQSCKAKAY